MLRSLCSKIIVLNVDLPLRQDDLHYCKLICTADPILLNKVSSFFICTYIYSSTVLHHQVIDDIYQFLFILLCFLCNQNEGIY